MSDYKEKANFAKRLLANITTMLGHYNLSQGDPIAVGRIIDELVAELDSNNTVHVPTVIAVEEVATPVETVTEAKPVKKAKKAAKKKGGRPRKNKNEGSKDNPEVVSPTE